MAYRKLLLLEEQVLEALQVLEKSRRVPDINVEQFYGMELDLTRAEIATVAMWLTDHQMNVKLNAPRASHSRAVLKLCALMRCG